MKNLKYPPGCKDIHVELTTDELIRRLKRLQTAYNDLEQSSQDKYRELSVYLGTEVFVEHEHDDVRLLISSILSSVFRIYAPESPFRDPVALKKIFLLFTNQLKYLKDTSSNTLQSSSYKYSFNMLQNLSKMSAFLLCLELDESNEIILSLFENAFKVVNDKTSLSIKTLLIDLMSPMLAEPEHLTTKVLDVMFARIIEPQKSNNKEACSMAVSLIKSGNQQFEFFAQHHLNNILLSSRSGPYQDLLPLSNHSFNSSGGGMGDDQANVSNLDDSLAPTTSASSQFISDKLCLIIYELCHIRYSILELVLPQLEYKLKSSDLKERREYTKLLSKMFSETDSRLAKDVPQLWEAYLERFADAKEEIRRICVQHICDFLVQQADSIQSITDDKKKKTIATPTGNNPLLDQVVEQIKERSLDSEESIRYEVVQEILKAIKLEQNLITIELLNILKLRTLDVKIKVRKLALQGLATLYKKIHAKASSPRRAIALVSWIPTKIMRIFFQESSEDKLLVERLLNNSIVPYNLEAREKMAQLYYACTTFDQYAVLSLAEIMRNRIVLYQLMRGILDAIDSSSKDIPTTPAFQSMCSSVAKLLLEPSKSEEFMRTLVQLLKTNLNLRKHFKNLLQAESSFSKTMNLIPLVFNNLGTLNQTQMGLAKRLIERMSSIIIDSECVEHLVGLVGYRIRQPLTPKQRRLLKRRNRQSDDEDDIDEDQEEEMAATSDAESEDEQETEESSQEEAEDRALLKHTEDDGKKGLELLSLILMIHQGTFADSQLYKKLFSFVTSPKDHISSFALKLLSSYFLNTNKDGSKVARSAEETKAFNAINTSQLAKLKQMIKSGTPKQAKYAVLLIHKNFEATKSENILYELYKELVEELNQKNPDTLITCLVSLGHICHVLPNKVGKEIKEFISKNIVKEMLNVQTTGELSILGDESKKSKRKLTGKWCENDDELPLRTRARIEAIKLLTRWALGLKQDCTNILHVLRILIKVLAENSESSGKREELDSTSDETSGDGSKAKVVSHAEMARVRSICATQLVKLFQEPAFKSLVTAEYYHVIAKLIIDPVNEVRELVVKKIQLALKKSTLPYYFMGMLSLVGMDHNKDRKLRVKKTYTSAIQVIRMHNAKQAQSANKQAPRILPESCLPYAISVLAHNIHIESLKEDSKVKQIKECMAMILEPLLESPDGYQMAYIKNLLNRIKSFDDGLAAAGVHSSLNSSTANKTAALQNLYHFNRAICFICEIFLFHLHSKSYSLDLAKEHNLEVKLPLGFFAPRSESSSQSDVNHTKHQQQIDQEVREVLSQESATGGANDKSDEDEPEEESNRDQSTTSYTESTVSRIEITKISAGKKNKSVSISEKVTTNQIEEADKSKNSTLGSNEDSSVPTRRGRSKAKDDEEEKVKKPASKAAKKRSSNESEEKENEDEEDEAPTTVSSRGNKKAKTAPTATITDSPAASTRPRRSTRK